MRLNRITARLPQPALAAHRPMPTRPATVIGRRRAIWSALHLLGAGIFVLAMLTRLAQADAIVAPDLVAVGGATLTISERPLPFDPHMH